MHLPLNFPLIFSIRWRFDFLKIFSIYTGMRIWDVTYQIKYDLIDFCPFYLSHRRTSIDSFILNFIIFFLILWMLFNWILIQFIAMICVVYIYFFFAPWYVFKIKFVSPQDILLVCIINERKERTKWFFFCLFWVLSSSDWPLRNTFKFYKISLFY